MGERSDAADEVAEGQPRVRTLLAGDLFVRNDLLRAALVENLGDQLEFSEISFEWPNDPFGPVAEVKEAAGTEDQEADRRWGYHIGAGEGLAADDPRDSVLRGEGIRSSGAEHYQGSISPVCG